MSKLLSEAASTMGKKRWAAIPKEKRSKLPWLKFGGRPRKYPPCPRYAAHHFSASSGRCPCGYIRP